MSTKPHTSATIAAVADSAYSKLNDADKRVVNIAIDRYLKDAKETGAEYEERVQSLRGIFSSQEKIAELKASTLETGRSTYLKGHPYEPGYAARGGL